MLSGWARIGAAASLLLALAACGSAERKAAKAAARYDFFYAQRDYYSARIEIGRAIAAQDDVPEYWAKLARAQLGLGKYLDAFGSYQHVLELDRNNEEAIQAMAELSYSGGSLEDSLTFANRMLEKQPRSLRMLLVKGSVFAARRQLAEAREVSGQMLAIDPTNEGGKILLARVQRADGDVAAAADTLEKSIAKDGETVAKLMALLDIYASEDDTRNAARIYARLFALQPANIDIRLEYAKSLYERNMPDQALAILTRLARAHPEDDMLPQQMVDLWNDVGSDAIDIDRLRDFVVRTGDPQLEIAVGHLLTDQKRYAEAEAMLRPFTDKGEISAANVEADTLYAGALAGLGRGAQALALIDRILKFDESNPRALLMRVKVATAAGQLDRALTDAQTLVRDNPDMAAGRIALADIYVRRKETVLADGAYAQAMNALSDNAEMLAAYLAHLTRSGREAMALDIARRFTEANPRLRAGWRQRALLCNRAGDEACVESALDRLEQLPGGVKMRRDIEAGWARPANAAGKAVPACGRTGASC